VGEIDIDEYTKDQITKYINRKFKGHGLARIVDAILQAQDYTTKISPPGPDGGVDILASGGLLGFDEPKICVQVKSTNSPINVNVLREMRGVMSQVNAKQGLLVSWGGFNNNVFKESKDHFFTIRLWNSKDLLDALFKYYEKFSDELKAELPLKRIWALVLENED
jgi:restriction system protein